MTRRRPIVTTGLFAVLLLATAGVFFGLVLAAPLRTGAGITPEAIAELRPGMTYDEAVAHFGCPPGLYGSASRAIPPPVIPAFSGRFEQWMGRTAGACVQFDSPESGGKVVKVIMFDYSAYRMIYFGRLFR